MATGDISSCYISSDGYSAYITVSGLSTGGTYDSGLGTNNNPSTAKIVFTLTSEGYSNSGALGTKSRTAYGVPCERPSSTGAMRKVYPDQSVADETVSGSDVVIRVALSEFIYNDDTSVTLTIESGWYTQGGTASNAVSGLAVTNNSALDYPRVVGNWAIPQCQLIVGTTLHLEFLAFHKFAENGKPVACVKFTVTDGTNTVTSTVTAMSISDDSVSGLGKIIVYQSDIDVTSLSSGVITAKAVAYPWIGDADSVLNTDDGVNTFPTPLYTNLTMRLDKVGEHGFICVSTTGNDTTGTVYSSQSAAEAGSACLTIASALTKLAAYHNTNSGHNDAGGGTILLDEATWTLNSANGGAMLQWVTIKPKSTALKANTIIQAAASNSAIPARLKLSGLTHSGSYSWIATSKCFAVENCIGNVSSYGAYNMLYGAAINNTGTFGTMFGVFTTYHKDWGLIRGNSFSANHDTYGYAVIGNKNLTVRQRTNISSNMPFNDNLVCAYNILGIGTTNDVLTLAGTENIVHGAAIVQNIIIRYGSKTVPLCYISGDSTTTTTNNIILHNNILCGARINAGYNDIASGGPYVQNNWSVKNNIFSNWNNKDDVFGANASGIGGWPVGYNVGSSGNLFRSTSSNEWLGEFSGLYAKWGSDTTPLSPVYVDDNSADGDNTSNGDYHLQSTSPAIGIAHDVLLPYDFEGNARVADNAAGVYLYPNVTGSQILTGLYQSGNITNTPLSINISGVNIFSGLNQSGNISIAELRTILGTNILTGLQQSGILNNEGITITITGNNVLEYLKSSGSLTNSTPLIIPKTITFTSSVLTISTGESTIQYVI